MENQLNVFDAALRALEAEKTAADAVDVLYVDASTAFNDIETKYQELRGVLAGGKFSLSGIMDLIKNNKGKILAVATAFGVPVGFADSGAFSTITGMLGKLGGLFGIG